MQEGICSAEKRLLLDGDPNFWRIAAKRLAKEAGRRDTDNGEGMTIEDHGRTNDGGVGPVLLLPGTIAQHGNRNRGRLVVRRNYGAAGERADAEGGKVIATDELSAQRFGDAVTLTAPGAELRSPRLKCSEFDEFGTGLLHAQIERIGEHSPVVLWATFDATVLSIADAIEAGWVGYRQRLQHDAVDEREDGRRGPDAEREGQHGRQSEDRRTVHLAKCVGDVLPQGLHEDPPRHVRRLDAGGSQMVGNFADSPD